MYNNYIKIWDITDFLFFWGRYGIWFNEELNYMLRYPEVYRL